MIGTDEMLLRLARIQKVTTDAPVAEEIDGADLVNVGIIVGQMDSALMTAAKMLGDLVADIKVEEMEDKRREEERERAWAEYEKRHQTIDTIADGPGGSDD